MQTLLSRILVLQIALVLVPACGSSDPPVTGGGGAGGNTATGAGGGGSSTASGKARVRFLYLADWEEHLGSCAWITDYRLKFGANPIPVTAPIVVAPDSLSEYVEVDGRTYADSDVLHIFSCSKSQTSKQTLQLNGKFGIDLPFEPSKRYTVTLGGTAASLAEDP